jgi:hypothetical protein
MEQRMIRRRRRIKHEKTFQDRLAEEAQRYKEAAKHLPPGTARELLLRRARQADTAANIDAWLAAPGLQPPKELDNIAAGQKKAPTDT